jgi:outer membrane immunogenic protein
MKRILFTTVWLGVLSLMSPAFGADLPTYSKAPVVVSPVYDWSGFYVGVYGGGGFGNHNLNNALGPLGFANFTINYDSSGAIAGGEVGYNWQSGNIVFGVEGDGFWSDIKGSDTTAFYAGNLPINAIDSTKLRYGGSLRARGGIAVDRLLLFFDGGWAVGSLAHTDIAPGVGTDSFTVHRNGLAAGGGIAYAITNNLIGKFEYRYYDFGRFVRPGLPNFTANGQLPYTVDSTFSVVTLGLDYKFGGPILAKY